MAADKGSISWISVGLDPLVLLLGITDNLPTTTHKKLFIFYAAFYARKAILLQWKATEPPRVTIWEDLVNAALPLYKMTYMGHNCPKKIHKI